MTQVTEMPPERKLSDDDQIEYLEKELRGRREDLEKMEGSDTVEGRPELEAKIVELERQLEEAREAKAEAGTKHGDAT